MPPVLLDISRSVSRIDKGKQTGIDRVEAAYIKYFLEYSEPVYFLARFRRRTVVLDLKGMKRFLQLMQDRGPWDTTSPIDNLLRISPTEKTLLNLAISQLLHSQIPKGFTYINVGHGKFSPMVWQELRDAGAAILIVMIHDVIPLDYPQFCKAKTTSIFCKNLQALAKHVDVFIYNSSDTELRTSEWLKRWNRTGIEGHVLLLGTDPLPSNYDKPDNRHPYFVCLGTIEPRKNHKLLLDIWAEFHQKLPQEQIPHLHIIGARGWMNEDVFHTLDTAPFIGGTVHERGQLPDEELGGLLSGAQALLFPSFAEGFGLPLVEALQMNVPVVCSDLPCFREIAGTTPTYLPPDDQLAWEEAITLHSATSCKERLRGHNPQVLPTWPQHFHRLNTIIADTV